MICLMVKHFVWKSLILLMHRFKQLRNRHVILTLWEQYSPCYYSCIVRIIIGNTYFFFFVKESRENIHLYSTKHFEKGCQLFRSKCLISLLCSQLCTLSLSISTSFQQTCFQSVNNRTGVSEVVLLTLINSSLYTSSKFSKFVWKMGFNI